jgi:hypothetical protein
MYLLKKFSVFDYKIITVITSLLKNILYTQYTIKNKIVITREFKFFKKKFLLFLEDNKIDFLLYTIGLKNGNKIVKKLIKQVKVEFLNITTNDSLHKEFKKKYFCLTFNFYICPYVQLCFKKNYLKICKILFKKKINRNCIVHKFYYKTLKCMMQNHKKILIDKNSRKSNIKCIFYEYKQRYIFYRIRNVFNLNNFYKNNILTLILWKFILKKQKFLNIYFRFKRFTFFIKNTNKIKKTFFEYFINFNLFERLYRKIFMCYKKLVFFWKFRFETNLKFKNNQFDVIIFQPFVHFVWQKKFYIHDSILIRHFHIRSTCITIKLIRTFFLKVFQNKFFLLKWNILF